MTPPRGYDIEAVLGRGRCSVVYLAREQRGQRKVALKMARRTTLASARQDFSAEFAALSALASRHVVQVFGHGVSGGDAFLAMEAALGSLPPGRRAAVEVLPLMRQAATALQQLHAQHWVHRDVKPANLLVRADGSLALADFGCARRQGAADPLEKDTVVGTPQYSAPEQFQGAPAQPAADVYSLGAVLHELLCGEPPFPGQTPAELFSQHLLAPVPRLAQEHAAWQPLLDAMLAKDPAARPAGAGDLLERLQRQEMRMPS